MKQRCREGAGESVVVREVSVLLDPKLCGAWQVCMHLFKKQPWECVLCFQWKKCN